MTGEQLRDELARLADRAPAVDLPADLYDRGRRATARVRVLGAAAAAACLALVVGLGWQVLVKEDVPVAGGAAGGVPDLVHTPPEGAVDLPRIAPDEVDRAAVVYTVDDPGGAVVAVLPDGRYRQLRLPDRRAPLPDDPGPVLSPDGTRLAYATQDDAGRGLIVVDLGTGVVHDVGLRADPGVLVRTLQWSPDGRSLAWSGQVVTSLTRKGASFGRSVAGVVTVGTGTSGQVGSRPGVAWNGLGVCDDGSAVRSVWPAFVVSDRGTEVRHRSWEQVTDAHGACTPPQSSLPEPLDSFESLVGWVPDGEQRPTAVVLAPRWTDDGQESFDGYVLRLVGEAGAREVGAVESTSVTTLSVATRLMSDDRPTVPAGPDPWPTWWEENGTLVLGAGVLATALLTTLALLRLRRPLRLPRSG